MISDLIVKKGIYPFYNWIEAKNSTLLYFINIFVFTTIWLMVLTPVMILESAVQIVFAIIHIYTNAWYNFLYKFDKNLYRKLRGTVKNDK